MSKIVFSFLFVCLLFFSPQMWAKDLFGFKAKTIDGKHLAFDQFQGKKKAFLIVNTASQCGYTGQYEGLQKLYSDNKAAGLVVMGFPSNDFGGQEPENNQKIKKFCKLKYGVSFPMFAKGPVKGEGAQEIFKWLTEKGGPVKWNFEKFLVGADGQVIKRFRSGVEPGSQEIQAALKTALAANPKN